MGRNLGKNLRSGLRYGKPAIQPMPRPSRVRLRSRLSFEFLEPRMMLTVPALVSIERDGLKAQLINATEASFKVTFSEPVTGVDARDFAITRTGSVNTNLALTEVTSQSTSVYNVTLKGITGSGTLGLNLASASSIEGNANDGQIKSSGDNDARALAGQTYTIQNATVVARRLFYEASTAFDVPNGSVYSDDNAIALDKFAYLAGVGPATFADVSSYDKGINGIMIDVNSVASLSSLTMTNILTDFSFRVGNDNSPDNWAAGPAPSTILVRPGAGSGGSDRIELIWNNSAPKNTWLQVTINATADTGLAVPDVFYFGSEVADSGLGDTYTLATTTINDEQAAQNNQASGVRVTNRCDYNRDGAVDASDTALAHNSATNWPTALNFILVSLPAANTNIWTEVPATGGPTYPGDLLLLSDGTVFVGDQRNDAVSPNWFKLTPDASGSYVNATWSPATPMQMARGIFEANVLQDGRVHVLGDGHDDLNVNPNTTLAEIYDPVRDIWTEAAPYPVGGLFELGPTNLLPDGRLVAGGFSSALTSIYDPKTDQWSAPYQKLFGGMVDGVYQGDYNNEEGWVKLPDGSLLSYDIHDSDDPQHAQRFDPVLNQWIDSGTVPTDLATYTIGAGLLLPNGKVIFLGATNHTAIYTPSTTRTGTGSWVAGPDFPINVNTADYPAAMLPNGHALFIGTDRLFYDYDPNAGPIGTLTVSTALNPPIPGRFNMLDLPNGQVLSPSNGRVVPPLLPTGMFVYTPTPAAQDHPEWRPAVSSITSSTNADGSTTYTLTGTQLNGISEGSFVGDEFQSATNYPLIRVRDQTSNVTYARTFNWSTSGVATGAAPVSVQLTLPRGLTASGPLLLTVIANGIPSAEVPFQPAPSNVVDRKMFYNNSFFDGNNPAANAADDEAIAVDKVVYQAGSGTAGFNNYSSYPAGINGIMVDLAGTHGTITASDFSFRISGPFASNDLTTWSELTTAPTVTVRPGAGTGGSDRVELTWPDRTILDTWLEVSMKANANTGLVTADTFYFGNLPGDTGNDTGSDFRYTDALDQSAVKIHSTVANSDLFYNYGLIAAITNLWDLNRDDNVDALDQSAARIYSKFPFGELDMINLDGAVPASLDLKIHATASGASAAVAAAFATFPTSLVSVQLDWVANGLSPGRITPLSPEPAHLLLGTKAVENSVRYPISRATAKVATGGDSIKKTADQLASLQVVARKNIATQSSLDWRMHGKPGER